MKRRKVFGESKKVFFYIKYTKNATVPLKAQENNVIHTEIGPDVIYHQHNKWSIIVLIRLTRIDVEYFN